MHEMPGPHLEEAKSALKDMDETWVLLQGIHHPLALVRLVPYCGTNQQDRTAEIVRSFLDSRHRARL